MERRAGIAKHCDEGSGMDPLNQTADIEARRMELRGTIRLASEVIAQYWPMRTFVHHNPLHSLEYLPFEETVRLGHRFLGGTGYLSGDEYRRYVSCGRIQLRHLDEALASLGKDEEIVVGPCRISHREVLRACLTHGLSSIREEAVGSLMDEGPDEEQLETLADHLSTLSVPTVKDRMAAAVREDLASLGHYQTLSGWCDHALGTQTVQQINAEVIKWCEAFLDEGHAAWAMPGREQGLYAAWKALAATEWSSCGILDSRRKIASLPEHPEDAVLESLEALGIPAELRQDYLGLQLAALPGWAGYIKWRAEESDYAWQQNYPVGLVKFLAIRLWYVRELVQKACREELGIDGRFQAVTAFMQSQTHAYFLRRERSAGRLPDPCAEAVDRLRHHHGPSPAWEQLAERYQREYGPRLARSAQRTMARRLLRLAQALEIVPTALLEGLPTDLRRLIEWMDAFPESAHGPVWLKAFEAGYHEQLFGMLMRTSAAAGRREASPPVRPQSQSVFCIDVRSEPFRRHLESTGPHETYGFAGFFAVFIRYRAWGKEHDTEQFPVIMRPRNEVREIPRSYLDQYISKHQSRAKLVHAGHTLLHDLKENVVTPYVMVESLGWFYGVPIVGKTVIPALYRRFTGWLRRLFVPPIATSLTVDKLSPAETEEMILSEQRALIWRALRDRYGLNASKLDPAFVEALRRKALDSEAAVDQELHDGGKEAELSSEQVTALLDDLRRHYQINQRSASRQKERITRTGFTLDEQVLTIETVLRMLGLVRNFARLVLFCAHGATSENNPFESALDCGACGGNEGKPNARVIAAMANRPQVRERLAKRGIDIPPDTHFLAGQVDTTTDDVQLFDLEDVPPTHRKDVGRLYDDLREASRLTSQERCARFPDIGATLPMEDAQALVQERSADWSQVRPEWGLSGNTSFVIGRRALTKGLNLGGRVFLHSYDYREDPGERLLEVLMTAPQVVAQWINMEHYFSAVDNEVYGSGSKIYHNVVGRFGIMSGPWSDLRLGLAWQTVKNGDVPYHEPMRLLTLIEAPRPRIEKLIARHEILQHFYHNEWVHLAALDPEDGVWYRYMPSGVWRRVRHAVDIETENA
ncbi:MAG: DUF2309 domain-containing protein [Nitrospiraceae bacterium]|nr:DUF2309 domain-containing protein [Nitrospiraceae bacterium]